MLLKQRNEIEIKEISINNTNAFCSHSALKAKMKMFELLNRTYNKTKQVNQTNNTGRIQIMILTTFSFLFL